MITDAKLFASLSSVVLAASLCVGAQVFAAEPADGVRAETVKIGDLNLSSPAGVSSLYTRIHNAANNVCGNTADGRKLANLSAQKSCAAQAEERAVSQINNPSLTAYFQMKTGRSNTLVARNNAQ